MSVQTKKRAWRPIYISNQAFQAHTSSITYEDQVLDNLNKISKLPGPQAGLLLPVKFYMAGTQASLQGSPVSQESEE